MANDDFLPAGVPAIPLLDGFGMIADDYDAAICDLWGVVHDGVTPHDETVLALTRFRNMGGVVLLLSNAPRPAPAVERYLDRLGVPSECYDSILTSGDLTRAYLIDQGPDLAVYAVGPDRDESLFAGLSIERVGLEDAEMIVCTGLVDDTTERPEDYRAMLEQGVERELPFVCANPDIQVMRGDEVLYCAGALAELYEQLGGTVVSLGKPHAPAYDASCARIEEHAGREIARERMLAIGDGINTDIPGANRNGVPCVLVTSGLHWNDFGDVARVPNPQRVAEVCHAKGLRPQFYTPIFAW